MALVDVQIHTDPKDLTSTGHVNAAYLSANHVRVPVRKAYWVSTMTGAAQKVRKRSAQTIRELARYRCITTRANTDPMIMAEDEKCIVQSLLV